MGLEQDPQTEIAKSAGDDVGFSVIGELPYPDKVSRRAGRVGQARKTA
jgi:hypothetical protein